MAIRYDRRSGNLAVTDTLSPSYLPLLTPSHTLPRPPFSIRYDRRSGNLAVTDLGRVASHYYIKCGTIEAFNTMLTAHLNDRSINDTPSQLPSHIPFTYLIYTLSHTPV